MTEEIAPKNTFYARLIPFKKYVTSYACCFDQFGKPKGRLNFESKNKIIAHTSNMKGALNLTKYHVQFFNFGP